MVTTAEYVPALLGVSPRTHRTRGWHMGREARIVALPFAGHSTVLVSKAIWTASDEFPVEPVIPIPSGQLYAVAVLPLSQYFSTQPSPALVRIHLSLRCTGLWHRAFREVSLCPACHRLVTALSSNTLERPTLNFSWSYHWWGGLPGCSNYSSPSAPPTWSANNILLPLFFFFPFFSSSYPVMWGVFFFKVSEILC